MFGLNKCFARSPTSLLPPPLVLLPQTNSFTIHARIHGTPFIWTRPFLYDLNLFALLAPCFTVLLHVLNRWRVARIAARASYIKDRDEAEDEEHFQKQKSFSRLCNFGLSYSADVLRRFPGSSLIGVASAAATYHGPMFYFFIGQLHSKRNYFSANCKS